MKTLKVMYALGWPKSKKAPNDKKIGYYNAYTVSEIFDIPDAVPISDVISLWDCIPQPEKLGLHRYSYYELIDIQTTMRADLYVEEHNKGEWANED